jgi:tRNA pseudouridine55 synthase
LDGVINVFKHPGVSSHDIVQGVRKLLKTKKVGHTGTLDPDAVGVLPICVGKATRLVEYLTSSTKLYRVIMTFGYETDTQDGSGQITRKTELPELNEKEFANILNTFVGEIEQIPPMFSAIKINGQPLYELARQGKKILREPRKVQIHEIKLIKYSKYRALFDVKCSKGTYIRTLCQDIGRTVNSSAYMSFLLRVQSGIFHVGNAFTLEELALLSPDQYLVKPAESLRDWPELILYNENINRVINGNKIKLTHISTKFHEEKMYKVLNKQGDLLAIGFIKDNYFKPEKVFR